MQIAILLFHRFAGLDAVALHDALSTIPGAEATFAAVQPGPWRDETGQLELTADAALAEIPRPQLLVLPGGSGAPAASVNRAVRGWVAGAAAGGWTVAVSDGVLISGRAGLLTGRTVAAPTRLHADLAALGASATGGRVVVDGRVATAASAAAAAELVSLLPIRNTHQKGQVR